MRRPRPKLGSKGFDLVQTCSVRRRDRATGRLVKACDDKPRFDTVVLPGNVRARVTYGCDATGEPATVRVLSVSDPEFARAKRRGEISPAEAAGYTAGLRESVREELQREFDLDRLARVTRRDVASAAAKKAAATRAKRAKAKPDRARAAAEADAVRLRLEALTRDLARTRSAAKREQLTRKRARLNAARTQLVKISQGRASKWPAARDLR